MRALTSLTTTLTLVLALGACGDDGNVTTTNPTTNTPTGNPTADTDPSGGTTSGGTDSPTTTGIMTSPTTTGDDTSGGTTADASDGTTTSPTASSSTTDPTVGTTTTDPGTETTVDPSDGTTSGTTGVMPGEDLYGPCDMGMCPAGQQCIGIMGIEGEYCAPKCIGDMECPEVPAGVTAQAQCALTEPMMEEPTLCALVCEAGMDDQCPAGETCKDIPMQMGIGLCTAP